MKKIENRYKCGGGLWKKFSEKEQIAYNNIRSQASMDFMLHPKTAMTREEFITIAHNFACLGAWEVKSVLK